MLFNLKRISCHAYFNKRQIIRTFIPDPGQPEVPFQCSKVHALVHCYYSLPLQCIALHMKVATLDIQCSVIALHLHCCTSHRQCRQQQHTCIVCTVELVQCM